jgi:hypothetical protein
VEVELEVGQTSNQITDSAEVEAEQEVQAHQVVFAGFQEIE